MIYLMDVLQLINNGKISFKIELFGKLLIQLIGREVKIYLIYFKIYLSINCRSMEFKYSTGRKNR